MRKSSVLHHMKTSVQNPNRLIEWQKTVRFVCLKIKYSRKCVAFNTFYSFETLLSWNKLNKCLNDSETKRNEF